MAKTKIIATLGPASSDYSTLRKMLMAGLDVVRLNFSHGGREQHLRHIELVRQLNKKYRRRIRIMQDLEGLRIRVGKFDGGNSRILTRRSVVWLNNGCARSGPKTIPLDYEGDLSGITAGQLIYIDDGNLVLRAKESSERSIKAVVLEGGELKQRKGLNIPGANLGFKGVTNKDKQDIEFGIKHHVDYVALSFVSDEQDVLEAAGLVKPRLSRCRIVAKIETREAVKNVDRIIDASDGIMIARGDMGVSLAIYAVPIIQKQIIAKCNAAGKFVITATQMLEHMTDHNRPTRAEVADVANAILDGTDFVMLSGETAVGKYPYEAVKMMNEIIRFTEKSASMVGVQLHTKPAGRRKPVL